MEWCSLFHFARDRPVYMVPSLASANATLPIIDKMDAAVLAREHASRHAWGLSTTSTTFIMRVVVATGVAIGLFIRLWFVFHSPTSSDEAVAGLIAQGALHGHFTAFYWGQTYGGTAEPDLIALAFLVFGQSGVVAELVVGALAGIAAILTWRVALRIVPPRIAPLAGVLAWAAPAVAIRDSIRVYGFRGVTLACGMGLILLALRMLDGQGNLITFAVFGFLAGIAWWSSPEIGYYVVPTVLLLIGALVKYPKWRTWWQGGLVALGAAVMGALPWLWVNLASGFPSLHPMVSTNLRYGDRLSVFFRYTLPMETGLRLPDSGAWILHSSYVLILAMVIAVLIATLGLCLARGGRALAIGLGVVAFPFLYAVSPLSGNWNDGRYASYLGPFLALTVTIGTCEAVRRLRGPPWVASVATSAVVAISMVLAVIGVSQLINNEHIAFTSNWGNPDGPTVTAISKLEAAGATAGYGGYWVPYKLDFLSQGRLTFTPIGPDAAARSLQISAEVARRKGTAWLFVPPSKAAIDGIQFVLPYLAIGPGGVPETQFVTTLRRLGVSFRVVDAGILDAVIPQRTMSPYQAKIPCEPATTVLVDPSCRKASF